MGGIELEKWSVVELNLQIGVGQGTFEWDAAPMYMKICIATHTIVKVYPSHTLPIST